jgi:uncharacterized Ntn-hydrolase superfamily protein
MTKEQKIDAIKSGMADAWKRQNPQAAATLIVESGDLQHIAMGAASDVGFIPEYYPNSIRVYLPSDLNTGDRDSDEESMRRGGAW